METTQTARHPIDATPPSFETVWALFQEVGKKQKETDRQMKETYRRALLANYRKPSTFGS